MIHMSPRWGFKTFGYPVVYKHAAPAGAKKLKYLSTTYIVLVWSGRSDFLFYTDMSPRWGFKTFGYPVVYKHAAPLGLKN